MSPYSPHASRSVRFFYRVILPPGGAAHGPSLRLWLPAPRVLSVQTVREEEITAPCEAAPVIDRELGNRGYVFEVPSGPEAATVELAWTIQRCARSAEMRPESLEGLAYGPRELDDPAIQRFLKPSADVPTDGFIAANAAAVISADAPPVAKARAIYDHLLETLSYDSGGCTPERMKELGDLGLACEMGTGTCTEWHGLYVGYLRSLGVPARFCFGFNLPTAIAEGTIAGYHCWAEVYLPRAGWFPVDVSEAYKQPEQRAFYFGALDCNRVEFLLDRELALDPGPQTGTPPGTIDKWIFGHGERQGSEVPIGQLEFAFRDL